ncbi:MAG: N-acetylglucosamine-6-phosphate deacetylase [Succinimonas sp.]|nr:N-acetylglucosamine-6-phosphate deacetylase [Succinimonas sp.]
MLKPAGKFAARALERWLSGEYRSLEMIKPTPGTPDPAPGTELSCQELQKSQEVYYLAPAFYDLQVNGYDGVMLDEEITREGLARITASLKEDGVFRFAPTVITCSYEHMRETLETVRSLFLKFRSSIPGVHLEGPFISPAKKGIHEERFIRKMTERDLSLLLEYREEVAYITADPAAVPPEYLKKLTAAGIRVSLGHTAATAAEAREFFAGGASLVTHLHNAMSHARGGRDPMATEAALADDRVYAGVIADGIHVAWPEIIIARKCLGERFMLVTDALAAAGVRKPLPSFRFAGTTVFNDPEKGCINADGTLGGSRLTMLSGVKNLIRYAGFTPEAALIAASEAPFRAMGEAPEIFLVLDENMNIRGAFRIV